MEIDRKELKRQARERMALTDPKFWAVTLTYLAMTTGVSWLFSFLPIPYTQTSLTFFQLLLNLYTTVVQFGLCLWALWTYRQLDPGINSLTQGFSVAGRVVLMNLNRYIRMIGLYLFVLMVLGIPFFLLLVSDIGAGIGVPATLILGAALLAAFISISLRYVLAPYLLADRPDDGATLPIFRSVSLMRGWKMELFKLEFSFIGWDLINLVLSGLVTFFFLHQAGLLDPELLLTPEGQQQIMNVIYSVPVVILSTLVTVPVNLRLIPYRAVTRAGFYDARMLAASRESRFPEMPPL